MKKYLLFLLVFITIHSYGYSQTINNLIGTWHNELGSTLKITSINPTTLQMFGTYTLNSGNQFPILGWANTLPPANNHVLSLAFSVRFGSFGSITSWTGYLSNKKGVWTITTIWNLTRPNSDQPWDHIITNCDVFTPGPAPKK